MATSKTVLILGGGVGGTAAARRLRKRLSKAHRVILVDREAERVFAPSLLWLMVGIRRAQQITRSIARLKKSGIEVVRGNVLSIDPETRTVCVAGRDMTADYIVVALGAELAPEMVPGLVESGHNFYTLDGAQSLAKERTELRQGRLVVLVTRTPFKCPAAPYEAAMLLAADFGRRGLEGRVSVEVFSPEPGPMPVAGPEVSAMVRQLVEAKGVRVNTEHVVTKLDPSAKVILFENGVVAPFDLLAYVPAHCVPAVVRAAGMAGDSGWIPVDRDTLETRFSGIYAIGDVTGIPLVNGRPLPKAGVFAHREAEVVASNIAHAITGRGSTRAFDGRGACFIEVGHGRAGFGSGNFFAEPAPQIRLRPPGRLLHIGKVVYEKYWLHRWF